MSQVVQSAMGSERRKKHWKTILLGIVLIAALAGGAMYWNVQREQNALLALLDDSDPTVRAEAYRDARYFTSEKAVTRMLDGFTREEDPYVLSKAGYALMITSDPRGLPLLIERADEGPDRELRAQLSVYIARHKAGDDTRLQWFREGLHSEEPWRKLGAAAGLLYMGQGDGGARLIELGREATPEQLPFILGQLHKVVKPMTESVGILPAWPDRDAIEVDARFWDDLARFWSNHGRTSLLDDVLVRLFESDPDWIQLNRLIHAREYAARILQ